MSLTRGVSNDLIADVAIGQHSFAQTTFNHVVPDKLNNPNGVFLDRDYCLLYIADTGNNRLMVYDWWPDGDVVAISTPSARYRLGEPSGTTMVDTVAGLNGTYVNAPTLGVAGVIGDNTAASFSHDTQSYGHVTSAAALVPSAAITCEGWVKTSTKTFYSYIMRKWSSAGYGLRLNLTTGFAEFFLSINGTFRNLVSAADLADGNWHHVVGTYDGTTMNLYVDAVRVATGSWAGTLSHDASDLYIGAFLNEWSTVTLDEVQVYSRALPHHEIDVHYRAGLNGTFTGTFDPTNPVRVLGQPDYNSSGANRDGSYETFPTLPSPAQNTLAFTEVIALSPAEGGMGSAIAIDSQHRVWFCDTKNHRALRFPLHTSLPDMVLGQADYTHGLQNRDGSTTPANNTLFFQWGWPNAALCAGLYVDSADNVWICDSGNCRVLRFPDGETVADLCLGHEDFVTGGWGNQAPPADMDKIGASAAVYVSDDRTAVWVADSGGARLLIFFATDSIPDNFTTGMDAFFALPQLYSADASIKYGIAARRYDENYPVADVGGIQYSANAPHLSEDTRNFNWATNLFAGKVLTVDFPGGQSRHGTIASNTARTITLDANGWRDADNNPASPPVDGRAYTIAWPGIVETARNFHWRQGGTGGLLGDTGMYVGKRVDAGGKHGTISSHSDVMLTLDDDGWLDANDDPTTPPADGTAYEIEWGRVETIVPDTVDTDTVWVFDNTGSRALVRIDAYTGEVYEYKSGRENIANDTAGSIGVTAEGDLLMQGRAQHDVRLFRYGTGPQTYESLFAGVLEAAPPNKVDEYALGPALNGIAVTDDYLVVAEERGRILYWHGLADLATGDPADGYLANWRVSGGPSSFDTYGWGMTIGAAADQIGHIWIAIDNNGDHAGDGHLICYQAPLTPGQSPIARIAFEGEYNQRDGHLYTLDDDPILYTPERIYGGDGAWGICPNADSTELWVSQKLSNRVLRIRNPLTAPEVDCVLGQPDASSYYPNRCSDYGHGPFEPNDPDIPDIKAHAADNTMFYPGNIYLDRFGNLYVSDHSLESDGNKRLLIFETDTIPSGNEAMIFGPDADRIIAGNLATWQAARAPTGQVVIGYNPYGDSPANDPSRDVSLMGRFVGVHYTMPGSGDEDQTLVPTGAGFYTEWAETWPIGGTHWQYAADDDGNTHVISDNGWNATKRDSYALTDLTGTPEITSVTVHIKAARRNTYDDDNNIRCFLRSNTTDAESAVKSLAGTNFANNVFADVSETWTTDPATGQPWTVAGVNALQAGARCAMSGGGSGAVCFSYVYVVVAIGGSPEPDEYLSDFGSMHMLTAFDAIGNLYVGDHNRARVLIYKAPFGSTMVLDPAHGAATTSALLFMLGNVMPEAAVGAASTADAQIITGGIAAMLGAEVAIGTGTTSALTISAPSSAPVTIFGGAGSAGLDTLAHFRDPRPPHRTLVTCAMEDFSYGFKVGEPSTAQIIISRDDPNMEAYAPYLRVGMMVSLERADGMLPWVGYVTKRVSARKDPAVRLTLTDATWLMARARVRRAGTSVRASGDLIASTLQEVSARGQPPLNIQLRYVTGGPTIDYKFDMQYALDFLQTVAQGTQWEWGFTYDLDETHADIFLVWTNRLGRDYSAEYELDEDTHLVDVEETEDAKGFVGASIVVGGTGTFNERPTVAVSTTGESAEGIQGRILTSGARTTSPVLLGTQIRIMPEVTGADALFAAAQQYAERPGNIARQLSFSLVERKVDLNKIVPGGIYTVNLASTDIEGPQTVRVRLLGIALSPSGEFSCETQVLE